MPTIYAPLHALLPALVGLLWGVTNPLIKRGSEKINPRLRPTGAPLLDGLASALATPSFVVPQAVNLGASALFTLALRSAGLSLAAPVANGVSIAATAVCDRLLGAGLEPGRTALGAALVVIGATLCAIGSPP